MPRPLLSGALLLALGLSPTMGTPAHGRPSDPGGGILTGNLMMGRMRTMGLETSAFDTLGQLEGVKTGAGAVTADATVFRSGSHSLKCFQAAGTSVAAYLSCNLASAELPAAPVTVYLRAYLRFAATPSDSYSFQRVLDINGSNDLTPMATVQMAQSNLANSNQLRLVVAGTKVIGSPTATLLDDHWYRVELSYGIDAGGLNSAEFRLDGVTVASTGGITIQGASVPLKYNVGFHDVVGGGTNGHMMYADDIALNNSSGAAQNSWPGDGQIVLLQPTADSQRGTWTGGIGGTTSLFDAVNNYPPIGTASETNLTQIESADSASNSAANEYRATMTTYTAAGVPATGTVTVCQTVVNHGEDSATGTKTGSVSLFSNPSQGSADPFTFGADAGALGTWPSNWSTTWGTAQTNPTVTLGTAPVVALRKTDAGTAVGSVDLLGLYVEYAPSTVLVRRLPLLGAGN